jgi:hypothetical protein
MDSQTRFDRGISAPVFDCLFETRRAAMQSSLKCLGWIAGWYSRWVARWKMGWKFGCVSE